MIIGIGCDIVDHEVMKKLNWEFDPMQLKRIFSSQELDFYNTKKKTFRFLAGRFAAKESIVKCLCTGMQDGIALRDIQISQGDKGEPTVELFNGVKAISEELGIDVWRISISHGSNYSMAIVIAEK